MKDTIQIFIIILTTFLLAFATSALLDITWVSAEISRIIMVWLLMVLEILVGAAVLVLKSKQLFKKGIQ